MREKINSPAISNPIPFNLLRRGIALALLLALLAGVVGTGCGGLRINSSRHGAEVLLDDAKTGKKTPAKLRLHSVSLGVHTVKVEKSGYAKVDPQEISVRVSVGRIVWATLFPPVGLPIGLAKSFKKCEPTYIKFDLKEAPKQEAATAPAANP